MAILFVWSFDPMMSLRCPEQPLRSSSLADPGSRSCPPWTPRQSEVITSLLHARAKARESGHIGRALDLDALLPALLRALPLLRGARRLGGFALRPFLRHARIQRHRTVSHLSHASRPHASTTRPPRVIVLIHPTRSIRSRSSSSSSRARASEQRTNATRRRTPYRGEDIIHRSRARCDDARRRRVVAPIRGPPPAAVATLNPKTGRFGV